MRELKVEARVDKLNDVLGFIDEELEGLDCPIKIQMQIDVAVEELFVNIASYAYEGGTGDALISTETEGDSISITFTDSGKPYDPLAKEDPDVTLGAADRPIGGLGIYMVKKSMDEVVYNYSDGKNILKITKNIRG